MLILARIFPDSIDILRQCEKTACKLLFIFFLFHPLLAIEASERSYLLVQANSSGSKLFVNGDFKGLTDESGKLLILLPVGPQKIELKSLFRKTVSESFLLEDLAHRIVFEPGLKTWFNPIIHASWILVIIIAISLRIKYLRHSPSVFGDYLLREEIGRGGIAVIYRAWDRRNRIEVALKIMDKTLADDPELRAKFLREGKVLELIRKKKPEASVVRVLAYGELKSRSDLPYIAMEYLRGFSLMGLLKKKHCLTEQESLKLIREIALIVRDCHACGITHRDLSPDNIMILDKNGKVVLLDFGVAKNEYTSYRTLEGSVAGKPIFMSPEQCRGEQVGPESDVYTLGVLLYLFLEGTPPFIDNNPLEIMNQHLKRKPPDFSRNIRPELSLLVFRMLEKKRTNRCGIDELLQLINGMLQVK